MARKNLIKLLALASASIVVSFSLAGCFGGNVSERYEDEIERTFTQDEGDSYDDRYDDADDRYEDDLYDRYDDKDDLNDDRYDDNDDRYDDDQDDRYDD